MNAKHDKNYRASASQFFIAGELCRRGLVAVPTMGNCPNTDILCSDTAGTKFVHIQVKTFVPGNQTCSVGKKAEQDYGENFFWVLGGIPEPPNSGPFVYYIIPAKEMAYNVHRDFDAWAKAPGKKGQQRNSTTTFRSVHLPPGTNDFGWDLKQYENRWDLIEEKLR
jgi:hypothetical protein